MKSEELITTGRRLMVDWIGLWMIGNQTLHTLQKANKSNGEAKKLKKDLNKQR